MTTAQAEKLKKLEAAYERAYKHGGEVALFNAQTALERFEAALERSEKLKAAGLRSRSNPRRRRNGGSYTVKGVPIGVPRHSFDPRKGDVFYVSGKRVTVKSTSGDMVSVSPSVQGMYALGMGNLYQIARVPEDSRFAPYEYRAGVKGNTRRRVNATWKIVRPSDVGKYLPGNKWKDFPIQARDVGKKYYIEDGMVFIENDEQMRKRAGKTNPYEYRARVKGNTRRRVNAASSTGKMIPAKVMVGKGGKVRVFVNPKHLPTLK